MHIVRDPRWGRMAETFGEDPLVNANMGVAHVRGLQGGSGKQPYIKAAATCKVRGAGPAAGLLAGCMPGGCAAVLWHG